VCSGSQHPFSLVSRGDNIDAECSDWNTADIDRIHKESTVKRGEIRGGSMNMADKGKCKLPARLGAWLMTMLAHPLRPALPREEGCVSPHSGYRRSTSEENRCYENQTAPRIARADPSYSAFVIRFNYSELLMK